MTKIKNKRLSNKDREILKNFAEKNVKETEPKAKLDKAYDLVADAVRKHLQRKYPTRDMNILKKYDFARMDQCIFINDPEGYGYTEFQFKPGDKRISLRPSKNCRRLPIQLDEKDSKIYRSYVEEKTKHDASCRERYRDFSALIQNTVNFNSLVDIWPAVEQLRSEIVGTSVALSLMSDDVMARIRKDPAFKK